ncbi:MAG: FKBP-type peptidylprolyl isomerase [Flavobacterium sp.]|uniref:FKBP-type peptidyl-prolyl cis-trans isomerase n=1 Tax=Flavobacterium sp. TaxID=239 RepID=UPI0025BDBBCB|nr:FKBP-type peptidylprolyl isomerase [Flavobacterium sp.]MCK6608872.1 FKBP-type peptidylprolyl isomerase [Flavobacterium sp.]
MKSLIKIALVLGLFVGVYSCQPDDSSSLQPLRPYNEVYEEDIKKIEDFLDTHYLTVDGDFNTVFTKIPDGGSQTPISGMPELEFKEVDLHDITYKVYYLKLREGTGESPTRVDSTLVGYKGNTFYKTTVDGVDNYSQTVFEENINPIWFNLDGVVRGWAEIVPQFKMGTYSSNTDGTISFEDFGVGVMFIPSGLAYFASGSSNIPSYSPLIFNFKLYNLKRMDHDQDGILSMYEYGDPLDNDRFSKDPIDTDEDGRPDYLDVDDDGDGFLTKFERSFTYLDGSETRTAYYPYFGALVDDPSTPYDDTRGIPSCSGDFSSSNRVRRHLDKTCKPPYTN